MNISKYIDYTLLKSTTTEHEIIELCQKAKENNYHSVCVNSCYVSLAKQLLADTEVKVCTVVGFPLGAMSTHSKAFEAKKAVEDGANEIDMVINLGYLKSRNYVSVLRDISDVKFAISNTPLKVIIEISELNKNEIIKACEICLDAKADFVKTSTGFAKSGATLTAVKIIKKTVKNRAKIKASGGISDYETALKYIEAGADRIGTSSEILEPANNNSQIRNSKIYKQYIDNMQKTGLTKTSSTV
ncbi:deoxyribose-phosphate aldolase [Flaviramulus sp. BrNp1-15]|uniref:deoxyribose-phosphate aldolase n=1 Tax=Flaviramulus sp. BrNp1-15 TaxID=2916754 RepID=UPI001EE7F1BE|nr:deoxyribose-phosphate aldolase [Flaviramulus sp. BrNp1-15]ULC58470.1 deoxyribose-phosphate aldolase [Flaviramulus sp. BrNp1-15]